MSPLHAHATQFTQRNTFLYASLGLLALAQQFEQCLSERLDRGTGGAVEPEPSDEVLRYALLGALSLGRSIQQTATATSALPAATGADSAAAAEVALASQPEATARSVHPKLKPRALAR